MFQGHRRTIKYLKTITLRNNLWAHIVTQQQHLSLACIGSVFNSQQCKKIVMHAQEAKLKILENAISLLGFSFACQSQISVSSTAIQGYSKDGNSRIPFLPPECWDYRWLPHRLTFFPILKIFIFLCMDVYLHVISAYQAHAYLLPLGSCELQLQMVVSPCGCLELSPRPGRAMFFLLFCFLLF